MKTKHIQFVLVIIILYNIIIAFCSCSKENNPVIPPPPPVGPDTVSRYLWESKLFTFPLYDLYVADTDLIYMWGGTSHSPIVYNGTYINPYNLNDNNFHCYALYGFDKNNIFWAGQTIKNNQYCPAIIKVTNGSPQSYILEYETGWLSDVLVTGSNQAWFLNELSNNVYLYENGNIKTYKLSNIDSTQGGKLFKNLNNELFVFSGRFETPGKGHLFTYKFVNDNFQFIRKDSLNGISYDPNCLTGIIFRCGVDAIMINYNKVIHYFNGNEWLVHPGSGSVCPLKVGGVSKDSLVTLHICEPGTSIYTFGTSKKWRHENDSPTFNYVDMGWPSNVEFRYGNVYFNHWDDNLINTGDNKSNLTYLLIGKPNPNFKK